MNKAKLKELKQKAQTVTGEGLGGNYYDLDEDKFAELIVKECIHTIEGEIAMQFKSHVLTHISGLDLAKNVIKERFGVR